MWLVACGLACLSDGPSLTGGTHRMHFCIESLSRPRNAVSGLSVLQKCLMHDYCIYLYNNFRIRVVLGEDRDVDKTDLSKLVYLEAVLKETMRLYPVVPVIGRITDTDVKLSKYYWAYSQHFHQFN